MNCNITFDRKEALCITKALSNVDSVRDPDLVDILQRIDRFLVGRFRPKRNDVVLNTTLHALKAISTGRLGTKRYTLEFEICRGKVNVVVGGTVVAENVRSIIREPALIRVYSSGGQYEFVVSNKLPAQWVTTLPEGRKMSVCVENKETV